MAAGLPFFVSFLILRPFYIVGPTATGKSDFAVEVARRCDGEIVNADAFQIYDGLDLLTAKPDTPLLGSVPHHLLGTVPLTRKMDAEQFRMLAVAAIRDIHARGKPAFVVGGSGMYVKALTHGLSKLPAANPELRAFLDQSTAEQLMERLAQLDPKTARTIDQKNKHRVLRAVEICLLTGRPASEQQQRTAPAREPAGVMLFWERAQLYERINHRVESLFAAGVVEEVRRSGRVSSTAEKTLGLHELRELIAGRVSEAECIGAIQQATRRYAKRQLTWFGRQTNFEPLNLSSQGWSEAIEQTSQKARLAFAKA